MRWYRLGSYKVFRCTVNKIMIVYLVAFTSFKQPFTYPRVYVRDVCMPWAMYCRISTPYFHCCIHRWASFTESGYHWRVGDYQRFVWFNDRINLMFLHCSGACDVPGARMNVGPRHYMKLQLLVRIGYLWSIGEDAQIFGGGFGIGEDILSPHI